jgi:HD-GYP domain-containing protein (c-di-GMP phosphodiesterase class II)
MTTETENWEPIEPDQLEIGHYIKINHRWFDHPFIRRMFQISSEREIAIVKEVQLTRMFVDRARSQTASSSAAAPAAAAPAPAETAPAAAGAEGTAEAAPDPAAAAAPAAPDTGDTQRIRLQRVSLDAAKARDRVTHERAQTLLGTLNSADPTSAAMVGEFVDYLVAILNNSTTPLALMAPTAQRNSSKRYLLQASDAVCLVALIGKRMGMKAPQLRTLTQAAATHILGLARLPSQMMDEEPGGPIEGSTFRNYPLLGAAILQQCGGFSAEVLRIVREHRERPDGRGFPRGLAGDAIHPMALILGAVREFQIRCTANTSPLVALAYLYKNCREIYGAEVIGHLASSLLVYPVGTFVQLSDGRLARIRSMNEAARMSPVVDVYEDSTSLRDAVTLDLAQCPGLSIIRALDTSYLPPRMFASARRESAGGPPPKAAEAAPAAAAPAAAAATEPAEAETAPVAQASGA